MPGIETKPYTYLIGWSSIGLWYYGVRYAKGCTPDDLWTTYFTSSKHVEATRTTHGEPDVIEVRRVFDNGNEARQWEFRVLQRSGVRTNDSWINKTAGGPRFNTGRMISLEERQMRSRIRLGKKQTPVAVAKTAAANRGRPKSHECKAKISLALSGREVSQDWRDKIGAANRGKKRSQEFKDKLSARNTGRKHTPETIEKMRRAAQARKAVA